MFLVDGKTLSVIAVASIEFPLLRPAPSAVGCFLFRSRSVLLLPLYNRVPKSQSQLILFSALFSFICRPPSLRPNELLYCYCFCCKRLFGPVICFIPFRGIALVRCTLSSSRRTDSGPSGGLELTRLRASAAKRIY